MKKIRITLIMVILTMLSTTFFTAAASVPVSPAKTVSVPVNEETGEIESDEISGFSLEHLQQRAVEYSRVLRRLRLAEERGEITREQASDIKVGAPLGGTTNTLEALRAKQAILGLLAEDIQLESAKKEIEMEEDTIQVQVLSAWFDLDQANRSVELSEESLSLAEQEYNITSIKHQFGMSSLIQKKMAEYALEEARNELERSRLRIETAYNKLNALAGFDPGSRYEVYREEDPDLDVPDIEQHIRKIRNTSPELWMLEKQVELAEWSLRLYVYNQEADPYSARQIDISTAELSLAQAQLQMDDSLRQAFNMLQQMKVEEADLQVKLLQATDNVNLAKQRLAVGMAIPQEVQQAEVTLSQLENALITLQQNYEMTLENYRRPWTVSGF